MKKFSMKEFVQRNIENMLIVFLASVLSFVFLMESPLHPWIGAESSVDSSVFRTVTLMMEKGYMPYRDSFDHKGPYLYILNWLGNRISENVGIWLIEYFNMIITLFILYKIARLVCGKASSMMVTSLAFSLLFDYFEGGNFTEEYAMPLIAISLYIFLDYLINQNLSVWRLISCGCCFAGVLLLRANMCSIWVVFCCYIFGRTIREKAWDDLRKFIIWFTVGAGILILPILFWLGFNDALDAFWEAYIVFNMKYTSAAGGNAILSDKWTSFFHFFNKTIIIIAIFSNIYLCSKKRIEDVVYLCYIGMSLLSICPSGRTYGHYGMVLIPMAVYPIAKVFGLLEENEHTSVGSGIYIVIATYCLGTLVMPNWLSRISSVASVYEHSDENNMSETVQELQYLVNMYTDSDDKISVYGNWDVPYVVCNRIHATKYSYQFPIGQVMPNIMDEYWAELEKEQPAAIIIQAGLYKDGIVDFVDRNGYSLIWSEHGESTDGILLYVK